jgi:hypothetical protein
MKKEIFLIIAIAFLFSCIGLASQVLTKPFVGEGGREFSLAVPISHIGRIETLDVVEIVE